METMIISVLTLVTLVLRIFRIDLMIFNLDQIGIWFTNSRFYEQPFLITKGTYASIGIWNLPLFHYLLIPLTVISREPVAVTMVFVLLNTAATIYFYSALKRYYSGLTILVATVILAVSPWLVIYSRTIWQPSMLFPLVVPVVFLLHQVILGKNPKNTFWLFLLLSLIAQIHISGYVLILLVTGIFIMYKVRIRWGSLLLGLFIGFLWTLPYIYYQLHSSPVCPDCRNFLVYAGKPKNFDGKNITLGLQIVNGNGFDFFLGDNLTPFMASIRAKEVSSVIFWGGNFLVLSGFYQILRHLKRYRFLIIVSVAYPVFYFLTRTKFYMHYYVLSAPFIALIMGIGFTGLLKKIQPVRWKMLLSAVVSGIFIFQVIFIFGLYKYIEKTVKISTNYGIIYSVLEDFSRMYLSDYRSRKDYTTLRYITYMNLYFDSSRTHENIARYFIENDSYELAIGELEKLSAVYSGDDSYHATLGLLYAKTGSLASASGQFSMITDKTSTAAAKLQDLIRDSGNLRY
ncbi:hypothetical protein A2Z33_01185 [Candidatus Gottesmanbacteria bacterium RBG_16_52_11]|uniref:Glycosyltransferase RgtA/B/C/D-like domain-containing protein n=1 Tax=Candidatus Gottesmanbacteria bacterium RBG_16_52_11 TaxID=1798374 RepID=A0A1F5YNQ8_9BACT|nr:MAG: hypothetical protein A2Z33_01185 [Candidatus Gottesmanbacteria bacterium RBG_16_52_11]